MIDFLLLLDSKIFYFRKIIPLPTFKASQETSPDALYEKGATVMAIYPQVIVFFVEQRNCVFVKLTHALKGTKKKSCGQKSWRFNCRLRCEKVEMKL